VGLLGYLRDIEGCRLVFVGAGPAKARLQRALPEAAFLGFLTGPELSAAYTSLDIFAQYRCK
jgi:phosphatidylinositol alpha 1,6-mannosyltransferase